MRAMAGPKMTIRSIQMRNWPRFVGVLSAILASPALAVSA